MNKENNLSKEVDHILAEMSGMKVDSEEYKAAAEALRIVCEARSKRPAKAIEPEAVLMAVTNILGIALVLGYERLDVITSKAFSMILRSK